MARGVSVVFFPRQGAFDAAGMDAQPELRLDNLSQPARARGALLLEVGLDEGHYPSVEFVPAFGTPLARQQPCQTLAGIGGLRLIVGGARDTEQGRGMGLGGALYPYQAQHLVFDLHQVAGVEERIGQEGGVLYPLGMRVEGTERFEADRFGIVVCQSHSRQAVYVI